MAVADAKTLDVIYDLGVSHNKFGVPLPDGTPYPEHATSFSGARALEFLAHFDRVRDRPWSECSFLDLGCAEGSTTFELSQMGSTAYGVEGRADGIRRAKALKSVLGFDDTHFAVGNVDDESAYREVDGIFNAGILYHLEDPVTCLERCAANARIFMYLDTGHMPAGTAEQENSRFARNFGKAYKIDYKGLELDAIDFAEPGETAEKQADGLRRGPRSGIGNSNSVWLSHESAIALMAKLGFPYHETVKNQPDIPRLRTCFYRTEPRPPQPLPPLVKPLPKLLPWKEAIERVRERDIDYLRRHGEPVLLIGGEPLLSELRQDLNDAGIAIGEEIVLPHAGRPKRALLNELTKGKGGFAVVASTDITKTIYEFVILDRFRYAFASFALARQ